ncbi:hypothetical protein PF005_g12778 [Phytophthora fragariae]|uniref:Secreted protein n=1 Tax=Phytophthora fragariae TaxID=53985 RepID=A0A6A3XRD9_9STRA|nr:hypothetical protein PF003_g37612 [Phytophthora fragariae]KAE8940412.1 hypothetical protein PF009_g9775 [Phytophthora fragariae]KAE9015870.1 hypothetical protein PF011_g7430 [Phytophthora fragariae]KAE9098466.1 hypothetical protein PF007_g16253 [Phytophthora fragariae]KAE9123969.1 hypothetical protein PF006_g17301 [Phytophthora fragariae]
MRAVAVAVAAALCSICLGQVRWLRGPPQACFQRRRQFGCVCYDTGPFLLPSEATASRKTWAVKTLATSHAVGRF